MAEKKYILYLGCPGFPYGMAEMEKLILISKGFVRAGDSVTVVSNRGDHHRKDHPELQPQGSFQGIEYIYTSGDPFYHPHFLKRNILKIKGLINEILFLRKRKANGQADVAILSTNSFTSVLYYVLLSKIIGFKTVLNHVEYYSSIKKRWVQFSTKLNHRLYDNYAPKIVSAVFPISDFLADRLKESAPQKPFLKIPTLTEFERYDPIELSGDHRYFLFCGSAAYKDVILFIIDSFNLVKDPDSFLYLVINGDPNDINEIKNHVAHSPKTGKIKLMSRLSQEELYKNYKNAQALLIPLRPTFQDVARFPHKFGEYLASGNPVISTNYGEVKNYFRDMDNMLIASAYDKNEFAQKMEFVINNGDVAKKIGLNGKQLASRLFDYRNRGAEISAFIHLICSP